MAPDPPPTPGPPVLLVSAHPGTAGVLSRLAMAWGWLPLGPAASAAAALALLPAARCAVLDDGVAGATGLSLALSAAGVPVVWLSGTGLPRPSPVLLKPLNPDRLRAAVASLLDGRARRAHAGVPATLSPWHAPPLPRLVTFGVPPAGPWHPSLRSSTLR